ncbi:hypothetical protein E7681_17580 [Thalassobius vesicularis]|uniref:Tautomerase family protein n=1 Tax=Thalassobius vesicularis TaxID=1294297 RepID=A0A4S3M5T0_9RHOB|nr:hypothetical protein [Thalassobius vesicularis]THD71616.1 hypothetical protein E7681_17580 [Thalassobius vesicularis]
MPNLKLFVDQDLLAERKAELSAALEPLRACIMERLEVPASAVQVAIVPVIGLPDQPLINVEIHIMPRPNRTRPVLESFGAEVKKLVEAASGASPAFRCMQLDAETYVALK